MGMMSTEPRDDVLASSLPLPEVDYQNGTWEVWSGLAKWSLTRVGEYRGIAAAMRVAIERNEAGARVFVTNGGHPNRTGTELLVSVKVKR
jgi:hypothetical protein